MDWLIEPLQFEFMRNALLMGILIGILGAVVGSYLVVQQMGTIAGVISHAVVPGLSLAAFLGIDLAIGAFVAGIASAAVISEIVGRSRIKVDAAMALVLATFLSLGVILITVLETNRIDLTRILFGEILGVTFAQVQQTFGLTIAAIAITKLFYQELLFYTFDPLGARASGLPVRWMYFGLICAITLTIIASMQAVGVLLAIAMLVGPVISAYLFVKELHEMMIVGGIIGTGASIIGLYLSYYLDLPSGAAIVLVIFAGFALAFLLSLGQGILGSDRAKTLTKAEERRGKRR